MDPKACLVLAAEAIQDDDLETAHYHLEDYTLWRIEGGFEPTIHGADVWSTGLIGSKHMSWNGDQFAEFLTKIL